MRKTTAPKSSVSTRGFNVIFRAESLIGKSFDSMLRLFARAMKRLQIGTERSHPQPGDMLSHVEPVRPNIGHAARRAAGFGIDAPVPICIVEQPVLKIRALNCENFAQITIFPQTPHLLHHRVVTQIVADAVPYSLLLGESNKFFALLDIRGQRLFADHVLASLQRLPWL